MIEFDVQARDLALGDVVVDPASDRTVFGRVTAEGMSRRVRVRSWCEPAAPGHIAFVFEHLDGLLAGFTDWASYPPDRPLIRLDLEAASAH